MPKRLGTPAWQRALGPGSSFGKRRSPHFQPPPSSSSCRCTAVMLRLASPSRTATMSLAALASALAEEPRLTERAYVVLEKQDLGERHRRTDVAARTLFGDVTRCSAFFCPRSVTLCSVLAVLLLLMVVMAVCVYKPLNRRWKPSRAEKPEPSARFPVTLERGAGS